MAENNEKGSSNTERMEARIASIVGKEAPPMPDVLPDLVCIDGHYFRINQEGVPQAATDALDALYEKEAKYEDIPEDLKAYEVTEIISEEQGS